MIDEGDIPSIQCKMNLRGSKSMRKVDDLSLLIMEFYVPALTPRLSSTETSLQLPENITHFAACSINTGVIHVHNNIEHVTISHRRVMNGRCDAEILNSFMCNKSSIFSPEVLETTLFQTLIFSMQISCQ
jgi:hypothetical protein